MCVLLQSRPLYDNAADSRAFVTPEAWDPAVRAAERHLNTLIVGGRGTGKTSLLHQMQFKFRESGERVAFVDATSASDALELAARLRDAILGSRTALEESVSAMTLGIGGKRTVAGASRQLSSILDEIGRAEPTLILLDGSSSALALYTMFGRMRDALWQHEHCWVVAIDSADRASTLKPPADAFFDVVLEIEPWSISQLSDMISRRLDPGEEIDDRALTASVAGANGSPRQALRSLSDFVVRGHDPTSATDARGRLLDEASNIGRPAAMLMSELLDCGQGNSSDEMLQASLGVTRSRLTQLFRDLLDHGLVVADTQRPDGPGRPRVVYRPAYYRPGSKRD